VQHSTSQLATPFQRGFKGSVFFVLDSVAVTVMGGAYWVLIATLLEPREVGLVATTTGVATIAWMLSALDLRQSLAKLVAEYRVSERLGMARRTLTKGLPIADASGALTCVVLLISSNHLADAIHHEPDLAPPLAIGAVSIPFQVIVSALNGAY